MPTDTYPLQDLLYRTTALTDDGGDIVEAYDTDAYGNTLIFDAAGTGGDWWADDAQQTDEPRCEFIFTGRRYDAETGLYFYRARYYGPQQGRFLQRDPLSYLMGMHLYHYVKENPVTRCDAWGLYGWSQYWSDFAGGIGAVADFVGEQVIPRVENAAIGAVAGAGSGAATGATAGAAVGLIGGPAAGVTVPGGAAVGGTIGAIGGGIGGAITGLISSPKASAGQVAGASAIGGVAAGLTGGIAGPLAGAATGGGGTLIGIGAGGSGALTGAASGTGAGITGLSLGAAMASVAAAAGSGGDTCPPDCDALLTECLNNVWQPKWNVHTFGHKKQCETCFYHCRDFGRWPSEKCPRPGQKKPK
jgi:RHS repeat-associated protein